MRIRVRDHVNPFSPRFVAPPPPLNFSDVFEKPNQPLHLDLGCALGRFVYKMAQLEPLINFLGVDIREPIIERAKRMTATANLKNLHYQFCNATVSIKSLLHLMPPGALQTVIRI
jgi:tRNA (guanine-N7-)-methyltransferase